MPDEAARRWWWLPMRASNSLVDNRSGAGQTSNFAHRGVMFDQAVRTVMQRRNAVKMPPETVVTKAAKMMANKNVGAVMVMEGAHLVGIFTERDIAFRVVARGLDPRATRLAEVMTPAPDTVDADRPFGYALLRMHERGFRHLPVVQGGKVVGIVSARSAMDPTMEEFVAEAHRREHFLEKR
jgi:CBS domain-containing protein